MTVRRTLENIAHVAGNNYPKSLDGLLPDEPWREKSLCAQTDPEMFFPEKGGSTREAKSVCASCPVAFECLEYAIDHDERHGIWGGCSERERRKIERDRKRAARAAAA